MSDQVFAGRRDLFTQIGQLLSIESAVRDLFAELDVHCPNWRTDAMASGEGTDGVNRAWRALARALGESHDDVERRTEARN